MFISFAFNLNEKSEQWFGVSNRAIVILVNPQTQDFTGKKDMSAPLQNTYDDE